MFVIGTCIQQCTIVVIIHSDALRNLFYLICALERFKNQITFLTRQMIFLTRQIVLIYRQLNNHSTLLLFYYSILLFFTFLALNFKMWCEIRKKYDLYKITLHEIYFSPWISLDFSQIIIEKITKNEKKNCFFKFY